MGIKAIETVYSGYRFRSRLEARWAVFFDTLGITYEYEPEGYDLGELGYYLPDFWLPQVRMWAEVKPSRFTPEDAEKCEALATGTGYACLMLDGLPAERNYWAYSYAYSPDRKPQLVDYLFSGEEYWKTEGRLFVSTGASDWEVEDYSCPGRCCPGVAAARQARFEHGEKPGFFDGPDEERPSVSSGEGRCVRGGGVLVGLDTLPARLSGCQGICGECRAGGPSLARLGSS